MKIVFKTILTSFLCTITSSLLCPMKPLYEKWEYTHIMKNLLDQKCLDFKTEDEKRIFIGFLKKTIMNKINRLQSKKIYWVPIELKSDTHNASIFSLYLKWAKEYSPMLFAYKINFLHECVENSRFQKYGIAQDEYEALKKERAIRTIYTQRLSFEELMLHMSLLEHLSETDYNNYQAIISKELGEQ